VKASTILGIVEKFKEDAFVKYVPSENPESEGGTIEVLLAPVSSVTAYLKFPSSVVGVYEKEAFMLHVNKSLLSAMKVLRDADVEFRESEIVLNAGSIRYRAPITIDYDAFKRKLEIEIELMRTIAGAKDVKRISWRIDELIGKLGEKAKLIGKSDEVRFEVEEIDDGVVGYIRATKDTGEEFEITLGKPEELTGFDVSELIPQRLVPVFFHLAARLYDFFRITPLKLEYMMVPSINSDFMQITMSDGSTLVVVRCLPGESRGEEL